MKAISVRIKRNSASKYGGQRAHDLRIGHKPKYVDYSRTVENSVIIDPLTTSELKKICEERRSKADYKRKMKSNAAIAIAGIITFSTEAQPDIENLSKEEQDKRFLEVAESIAKELNTSLNGLVVHRDESAIHAHFTLAAYNFDGKPVSETINREKLSHLQDVAAIPVNDLGIGRGKKKQERIADGEPYHKVIHRSVKQLHEDLPKEIEKLNEKLQKNEEKLEKNERLLEKTINKLKESNTENEKLEKRAKTYEKRIKDSELEIERLQKEIERLQKIIKPHEPKPKQIEYKAGEIEKGFWIFKHKQPVLKNGHVFTKKAVNNALISVRKETENEIKNKLERMENLEQDQKLMFNAIENTLNPTIEPKIKTSSKSPELIKKTLLYNATIIDYGDKIKCVGDGSKIQQVAALYIAGKDKWKQGAIFSNVNIDQVKWLVKNSIKDNYKVSFKDPKMQKYADIIAQKIKEEQKLIMIENQKQKQVSNKKYNLFLN